MKAVSDVLFLAFATFTLHSRVLRALAAAERADVAYRAASVELIERLSIVGEHRDDLTGGHARRIGAYAGCLGSALGLGAEECERLELAATLHDLGKVGIPDAILNKAGDLTPTNGRRCRPTSPSAPRCSTAAPIPSSAPPTSSP